ncbi:hypothetical protein Pfo_022658 [Paulownia fortunei]|nr:hypothetical protein Pfo_022658 [Paulownia fortunei]
MDLVKYCDPECVNIGLLDGTRKPLKPGDEGYQTWHAENSMLMAWLINSMEPEISQGYIFYTTAKDIWEAVNLMYSNQGNDSKLYELSEKARSVKQGDSSVMSYYNALNILYQEIDLYQMAEWKDPEDQALYRRLVEKDRVFKFLAGLRTAFDQERGRILSLTPIPSLREVFNVIRREESRLGFMMVEPKMAHIESSALAASKTSQLSGGNFGNPYANVTLQKNMGKRYDKDSLWCDHCQKSRHTHETCWKINGRPQNFNKGSFGRGLNNNNGGGQVFQAISEPQRQQNPGGIDFPNFSKEQLEQFYRFMSQNVKINTPSANLAQSGNFVTALSVTSQNSNHWIIDSGATDHMSGSAKFFYSYIPCSGHKKVKIADGSLSSVVGKGSVQISKKLFLNSVLHVPNLSCNLVSISKLTRDLNCSAKFSSTHCVFQDLCTGKKIGSAREVDGLFLLEEKTEDEKILENVGRGYQVEGVDGKYTEIWMWHLRLGHPSFLYLKYLFPELFKNKDISLFKLIYGVLLVSKPILVPVGM